MSEGGETLPMANTIFFFGWILFAVASFYFAVRRPPFKLIFNSWNLQRRGKFGIRAKSGHKPKRPLSENAYLSGRWKSFTIQLKKLVFLSTIGRTISGHPEELSKTGVWPGDWTKLPQEHLVENQCFSARKCPCDHFLHVSRTYPTKDRNWRLACPKGLAAHGWRHRPPATMAIQLRVCNGSAALCLRY